MYRCPVNESTESWRYSHNYYKHTAQMKNLVILVLTADTGLSSTIMLILKAV